MMGASGISSYGPSWICRGDKVCERRIFAEAVVVAVENSWMGADGRKMDVFGGRERWEEMWFAHGKGASGHGVV